MRLKFGPQLSPMPSLLPEEADEASPSSVMSFQRLVSGFSLVPHNRRLTKDQEKLRR